MGKTKVCHLTSVHKIDDSRIFQKECVSLAKFGFDVTIIACGEDSFRDTYDGVKRICLNIPVNGRLERFLKRSRAVYKEAIKVDADIYHFHDPELLPIGLKLKRREKKVIFDSHEFYGLQIREKKYIPFFLRSLIVYLFKQYEKYVCKKIDAVIQICTVNGENYFENRAKRTVFVANAPRFQNDCQNIENNFDSRNSVVHIGSLTYNRGITHIVKATKIANTRLILGGNFHSKKYETELFSMNEFSNVDFNGYINSNEMNEIFKKCFAGLSTLLHVNQYDKIDTLPTKVYNFMAAGLPVIISNTNFSIKMIKKYNFGIVVNPDNIQEIADAIIYLKKNKKTALKMGENGRKAFEEKFNWQVEEKKLIELYNSI